jgi:hypothetical protein
MTRSKSCVIFLILLSLGLLINFTAAHDNRDEELADIFKEDEETKYEVVDEEGDEDISKDTESDEDDDDTFDVALFWSDKIWDLWLSTFSFDNPGMTVIPVTIKLFALSHLAMFDASNSIRPHYKCYVKQINFDHLDAKPNYDIAISTAFRLGVVHSMYWTVYHMDDAYDQILDRTRRRGVSEASIKAGMWVGEQAFFQSPKNSN